MPQIIPIKDLKNTAEISELCHRSEEPIYITKNGIWGYGNYEYRKFRENNQKAQKCIRILKSPKNRFVREMLQMQENPLQ